MTDEKEPGPDDKCCGCGATEGLSFVPDPYAYEINGNDEDVWECESCRHESAMDI